MKIMIDMQHNYKVIMRKNIGVKSYAQDPGSMTQNLLI